MKQSGLKSRIPIIPWVRSGYALGWRWAVRRRVKLIKTGSECILEREPKSRREKTWKALERIWNRKSRKKTGGKRHGV